MSVLLDIRGVGCDFGSVRAVDEIDLAIRENEFFALLGASGSGKTTLLRMLAGFQTPSRGEILLDGQDITHVPPEARPVNMMFQSYALFPHMTVRRNVAYGLEMEKRPRDEIGDRVQAILKTVKLAEYADRKPDQLSGGQQQRVALARALVKRPRLLLLDEPLGALDKKLRGEMQLELKRLQDDVGITFIVVTHDQEEALVMADRIAILDQGRLVQCAPPRDIYEHPASAFAAGFIGTMNFLPVTVKGDAMVLNCGAGLKADARLEAPAGVAAVRPERLRIAGPLDENRITGRVIAQAYHGLDLQLHVESPAAPRPVVIRITADQAETAPGPGEEIALGWAAKDTKLFPTTPEGDET